MNPKSLLSVAVIGLLTACAAPPAPSDTFYRLDVDAPGTPFAEPVIPGVLEVNRLDTDGVLAERALAYHEDGTGLQRYRYDFWSEQPGSLVQDALAARLRAMDAAQRVVTPDLRVPPDFTLRGKLRRFEQNVDEGTVSVAMDLALVSARNGDLVMMESYAADLPTRSTSAADAVDAVGEAVSRILNEFTADLSQAKIPAPRR